MSKYYELSLPVFKQGDDLGREINEAKGNLSEAFKAQAKCYEEAARLCKRMSQAAIEHPDIEIKADTHTIDVEGPKGVLVSLEEEGILTSTEVDDEEDDGEGNFVS
jgi:hypothetical protein